MNDDVYDSIFTDAVTEECKSYFYVDQAVWSLAAFYKVTYTTAAVEEGSRHKPHQFRVFPVYDSEQLKDASMHSSVDIQTSFTPNRYPLVVFEATRLFYYSA